MYRVASALQSNPRLQGAIEWRSIGGGAVGSGSGSGAGSRSTVYNRGTALGSSGATGDGIPVVRGRAIAAGARFAARLVVGAGGSSGRSAIDTR